MSFIERFFMPHFFINSDQVKDDIVEISDKENYNHIAGSLRSRAGESLLIRVVNKIKYETINTEISGSKIFTLQKGFWILNFILLKAR